MTANTLSVKYVSILITTPFVNILSLSKQVIYNFFSYFSPIRYQDREGWAPAMYLKKPNPSQLQAMGSSIKRKDETNKGSVQSAPKVSGKATLSLVIRRTRFTAANIYQGNYN